MHFKEILKPQNKLHMEVGKSWIGSHTCGTNARCEGCGKGVCCVNITRPVETYIIISFTIILASSTHLLMRVCNILIYVIFNRCFSLNGHTPIYYLNISRRGQNPWALVLPKALIIAPFWGVLGPPCGPWPTWAQPPMLVVGVGSLESPSVHSWFIFLSGLISFYQPHLHIKPACNSSLLSKEAPQLFINTIFFQNNRNLPLKVPYLL